MDDNDFRSKLAARVRVLEEREERREARALAAVEACQRRGEAQARRQRAAVVRLRGRFDAVIDRADAVFEDLRATLAWQRLLEVWPRDDFERTQAICLPVLWINPETGEIVDPKGFCAAPGCRASQWSLGKRSLKLAFVPVKYPGGFTVVIGAAPTLRALGEATLWQGTHAAAFAGGTVWLVDEIASGRFEGLLLKVIGHAAR